MSDLDLMKQVFVKANGGRIRVACRASSIPENFLAALVAGESGGDFNAKRFEPAVFTHLWEVCVGRKAAYGSIGGRDLLLYVMPKSVSELRSDGATTATISDAVTIAMQRLDSLATSWGLTQIMGYNVLEVGKTVDTLRDPDGNLNFAIAMLTRFAARFHLDVTKDFADLFRCWNTGQPDGKTFDPNYVINGLNRMAVWPQVLTAMGASPE